MLTICTAWKQAAIGDPQRWANTYRSELVESLARLGVRSAADIEAGMRWLKARGKDWLPTPDAFAESCIDFEALGLPTFEAALRQALTWARLPGCERHPAVLAALREIDGWQFRCRDDEAAARKRFSVAWRGVVDRVRAEGTGWLPAIPSDAPALPRSRTVDRARNLAQLQALRAMLGDGDGAREVTDAR